MNPKESPNESFCGLLGDKFCQLSCDKANSCCGPWFQHVLLNKSKKTKTSFLFYYPLLFKSLPSDCKMRGCVFPSMAETFRAKGLLRSQVTVSRCHCSPWAQGWKLAVLYFLLFPRNSYLDCTWKWAQVSDTNIPSHYCKIFSNYMRKKLRHGKTSLLTLLLVLGVAHTALRVWVGGGVWNGSSR